MTAPRPGAVMSGLRGSLARQRTPHGTPCFQCRGLDHHRARCSTRCPSLVRVVGSTPLAGAQCLGGASERARQWDAEQPIGCARDAHRSSLCHPPAWPGSIHPGAAPRALDDATPWIVAHSIASATDTTGANSSLVDCRSLRDPRHSAYLV